MNFRIAMGLSILTVLAIALALTLEHPPIETFQRGYRGLGMVELFSPEVIEGERAINRVPAPQDPVPPGGPPATQEFKNVQVLTDVSADELTRMMLAITDWVAPVQGCAYCHAEGEDLSSDKLYTKVVARRMLQMTRDINSKWMDHVHDTGVTCFTCHRGNPVPAEIWFNNPGEAHPEGVVGAPTGKNEVAPLAGFTALPYDPLTPFLEYANDIRVVSTTALPEGSRKSIKQTEWTYALMMQISQAIGVNCTFCHNSRSFFDWDQSTPQRQSAFYGIRLVRELNTNVLDPLKSTFPHERLGPLGDVPKVSCATCHRGVYKPLFGANMIKDYPELAPNNPGAAAPAALAPNQAPATPP
jgi:photosynthetic reaction center cytochrome c subunit